MSMSAAKLERLEATCRYVRLLHSTEKKELTSYYIETWTAGEIATYYDEQSGRGYIRGHNRKYQITGSYERFDFNLPTTQAGEKYHLSFRHKHGRFSVCYISKVQ